MHPQDRPDIDLLLASLRADASDAGVFLQALGIRLEGALPGRVEVERNGGLFAREKRVKAIELMLGEHRYHIEDAGHGRLQAHRTRMVRGIVLKTETMSVDEWLTALANELTTLAGTSSRERKALERLLLG